MMKKTKIILPALAVVLVIGLMVGPALAYFTAHTEAAGYAKVSLGFETIINETPDDNQKVVTIENKGPQSVWVRVAAFSKYPPVVDEDNTSAKWTDLTQGYYYYTEPLGVGTTEQLTLKITKPAGGDTTEEFNVIVIYECTPVEYDADGGLKEANWNIAVPDTAQEGGGN